MRPFDLKKALAGEKVTTRDGRPVKIAGYNEDSDSDFDKLLGWADRTCYSWDSAGIYDSPKEHSLDLFMAPEKREVWVCYWREPNGNSSGIVSGLSKTEAEKNITHTNIITTVKIWEEEI